MARIAEPNGSQDRIAANPDMNGTIRLRSCLRGPDGSRNRFAANPRMNGIIRLRSRFRGPHCSRNCLAARPQGRRTVRLRSCVSKSHQREVGALCPAPTVDDIGSRAPATPFMARPGLRPNWRWGVQ